MTKLTLPAERFFSSDRSFAAWRLNCTAVAALPIVSPHGHVDPRLFSDPNATFGSPADLFIIPDHYVTRMLYSQGIELQRLGVRELENSSNANPNP